MEIKKIFLTTYAEKKWLEEQAKNGYALKKHHGITYVFEKSDSPVFYRYIFLKKGRKSFLELDYKNRDPKCEFIYGNGFVALFSRKDAYPGILSGNDLKLNYLKHRQSRQTAALCYIMGCCIFALATRVLSPLCIVSVLFAVLGVLYVIDARKTDKMIKEEL